MMVVGFSSHGRGDERRGVLRRRTRSTGRVWTRSSTGRSFGHRPVGTIPRPGSHHRNPRIRRSDWRADAIFGHSLPGRRAGMTRKRGSDAAGVSTGGGGWARVDRGSEHIVGGRENGVVGVGTPARLRSRGEFLRLAGGAGIGAAIVPIFAAACVPPGGRLDQRALAKVGPKGQQEWEASKQTGSCDIEPPNVGFEAATFGFAQSENNNPWRIA